MRGIQIGAVLVASVTAISLVHEDARASQRRFTYTYESLVLNRGEVEVEPWTTFRIGKDEYYSRIDQRIEFEVGLSNRLQTAFYLNMHSTTAKVDSTLQTEFEWGGISNEWKLKLRDPVADPFGLALYFEWGASTKELELEAKVIADKRSGNFLVAFNASIEPEWEFEVESGSDKVEAENESIGFEFNLAGAYFLSQRTTLGIEVRNANAYVPGEGHEYSALFAGPAVSYAAESWWATLTLLPQVAKLKGTEADAGRNLVLSDLEKFEARLIFGMDL